MNITVTIVNAADLGRGFSGADWWFEENGDLTIRISKMSDWKREACLVVHEMVEAILCKAHGVKVEDVDAFDADFEATHNMDLNAGDDDAAPYRREHNAATAAERIVAGELDVPWASYDAELAAIPRNSEALRKLRKFGLIGNAKQVV